MSNPAPPGNHVQKAPERTAAGWGRWLVPLAVVAVVLLFWGNCLPGGGNVFTLGSVCVWLGLAAAYLARAAALFASASSPRAAAHRLADHWDRWLLALVVFSIGLAGHCLDLPRRAAFHYSRPAMERLVEQASSGADVPEQWVGVYYATGVETTREGVRFRVCGAGSPWFGYGFLYSQVQFPPTPDMDRVMEQLGYVRVVNARWKYKHWDGPWYI